MALTALHLSLFICESQPVTRIWESIRELTHAWNKAWHVINSAQQEPNVVILEAQKGAEVGVNIHISLRKFDRKCLN